MICFADRQQQKLYLKDTTEFINFIEKKANVLAYTSKIDSVDRKR